MKTLKNGTVWYDTNNQPIHAHGGHIVNFDGTYYWYGENRDGGNFVSCYASTDLMNWEFRSNIVYAGMATENIGLEGDTRLVNNGLKVNIERPKIVYCAKTGKYVMWAHYEIGGGDYTKAAIALASSDRPDEGFVYHGWFRPFGHMSRDCNVFEQDGKMYFISASNDNKDLHIYQMTDDYLGVESQVNLLFKGLSREAPALFWHNDEIYMLTSQCTGWRPNQCGYSHSDSLSNEWCELRDFGDKLTYRTQSTAVLTLEVDGKKQYVYIGDRWGGSNWNLDFGKFDYTQSNYYFSLIEIDENGMLTLLPCDDFTIDLENGGFQILS